MPSFQEVQPLDLNLELYERQPNEPDQAFEAFCLYRDMGVAVRSIKKAAKKLNRSQTLLGNWNRIWSWRTRVTEWDRFLDSEVRKEDIKAARDMRKRHIKISLGMQRLASLELNRLLEDAETKSADNRLTSAEVTRLFEAATKIERLNRDLPNEIVESRQTEMTEEDMDKRINQLLKVSDMSKEDDRGFDDDEDE